MSKWIAWHGLEDKPPTNKKMHVLFRNGDDSTKDFPNGSHVWRWSHKQDGYDIVAYQIIENEVSQETPQPTEDAVNNPKHYTSHPSGIECIDVTRHMSFNLGNATKYIWRCDLKKDAIEDLRKAIFYLNDEINLRLSKKEC